MPPGIGIALIGVDRVNVRRNKIKNNNTFGVAVAQWCLVAGGCTDTDPPPTGFPDTWPDGNRFVNNVFKHNGTNGQGDFAFLAADITYVVLDATHTNCFAKKNTYSTFKKLVPDPPPVTPIVAKNCD